MRKEGPRGPVVADAERKSRKSPPENRGQEGLQEQGRIDALRRAGWGG